MDALSVAAQIMSNHIPQGSALTIEQYDSPIGTLYIYRLEYTSPKSGRKMCLTAKGDTLPTEEDSCMWFYLRQIVIDENEVTRQFNRLAWKEKQARIREWMDTNNRHRISPKEEMKDNTNYVGYIND